MKGEIESWSVKIQTSEITCTGYYTLKWLIRYLLSHSFFPKNLFFFFSNHVLSDPVINITAPFSDKQTMLKQWYCVLLLTIILANLSGKKVYNYLNGLKSFVLRSAFKLRLVNFDPFCLFLFSRFLGCRRKLGFQMQSSHMIERCSNEMSVY